jgi:hypothetical protein
VACESTADEDAGTIQIGLDGADAEVPGRERAGEIAAGGRQAGQVAGESTLAIGAMEERRSEAAAARIARRYSALSVKIQEE